MKKMYENLLDAIGNTPLVRLNFDTPAQVYAKLEYLNPGGSIKDRAALYMIEQAEKTDRLKPGGTIIEASSGNQGIAAALIGAVKGYKVIITVSEKISTEKKNALRAYGVELVICPSTTFLEDPTSYHSVAVKLHQQIPNSFFLNQYFNVENADAHYALLGPEIWQQTNGTLTHFCGAVGSGGTVSGAGKFLKEKNPHISVLGVDAATSYRTTKGNPTPYKMEGIGVDFDGPLLDESIINEFLLANDTDSITMLKKLARHHGLLVGPSSGSVAHAVYEYSKTLSKNDVVVMVFGDSGRAYLTKDFY
ncbi:MAG: cysteine synthase family protein [Candidatus Babeliaceae bacterium]